MSNDLKLYLPFQKSSLSYPLDNFFARGWKKPKVTACTTMSIEDNTMKQ